MRRVLFLLVALVLCGELYKFLSNRDCYIKENISYRTGERIYHCPTDRYYEETVINQGKGERCFRSEGEAIAHGWRRAYL